MKAYEPAPAFAARLHGWLLGWLVEKNGVARGNKRRLKMIKTAIGPAFLSFSNVKLNKLLFGLYFIIYLFLSSVTKCAYRIRIPLSMPLKMTKTLGLKRKSRSLTEPADS
jgi:hypothetical protein